MNIQDAKNEIKHTFYAYNRKDAQGRYLYPRVRQRPILLIGPPGIGKTAIMEQVAEECQAGLVAYTITHHTRQSAIGLPRIENRTYAGADLTVTEYTMSEIIASVYACMEKTGKKEGILFIDEINCVSETLAPTMLQFLQNKTFGNHPVPEGWLIVTAGNPPEYNKSVREFDIATLDRVRRISVQVDLNVWEAYARQHRVHPAILSYLAIYKEHFYIVETTPEEKHFVTARGWEDLSELLWNYEKMGISIGYELVMEYLQKEDVARSFASYYKLYCQYGRDYGIPELLTETCPEEFRRERLEMAGKAGFDERLTIVELILDTLYTEFHEFGHYEQLLEGLHQKMKLLKGKNTEGQDIQELVADFITEQRKQLEIREDKELISIEAAKMEWEILRILEENLTCLKQHYIHAHAAGFSFIADLFAERVSKRAEMAEKLLGSIEAGFAFAEEAFGEGQELVLLVSSLGRSESARAFLTYHESEAFLRHSKKLLYREREKELQDACRAFQL